MKQKDKKNILVMDGNNNHHHADETTALDHGCEICWSWWTFGFFKSINDIFCRRQRYIFQWLPLNNLNTPGHDVSVSQSFQKAI